MKRRSILGVIFITALFAGMIYIGAASAEAVKTGAETSNRPESVADHALLVDDFTAPVGTILKDANWSAHSGTPTNEENVVSPGLTYSGYSSSGIGNAVAVAATGEDINRQFNVLTSGSVYAAAMVNVTSATTTGDYFFHFLEGSGFTLFKARLFIKKDAASSNFAFGIQKSSTTNATYTGFNYSPGTTYLVVIKYTMVPGATNDTADLFVNPTLPGSEPAPTVSAVVGTDADVADIRAIAIRQGGASSGPVLTIDGIRVATSWAGLQASAVRHIGDFDADGKTDLAVFRPSEGNWYLNKSTAASTTVPWGLSTDTIVPQDFDGDGRADVAVYRPGSQSFFYILNSNTGTISSYPFGTTGDVPEPADYDGDGKAEIAVYRPTGSIWWIFNTQTGAIQSLQFGLPNDIPLTMDFDGDGKMDLVAFRPSNTFWYFANATGVPSVQFFGFPWGQVGDTLVPGDYDGDGKDDVAVFRPTNSTWYIRRSSDLGTTYLQFGTTGDIAVPGDYDGDGIFDQAVYRSGVWYENRSTTGFTVGNFGGIAGDQPIPAAYHP